MEVFQVCTAKALCVFRVLRTRTRVYVRDAVCVSHALIFVIFARMLLLFERLAVTVFTIYLFEQPLALSIIAIIIHGFFTIFSLAARPYKSYAVSGLVVGTGAGLTLSSVLALLLCLGTVQGSSSLPTVIFVLAFDAVVPPLVAIVMGRMSRSKVGPVLEIVEAPPALSPRAELERQRLQQELRLVQEELKQRQQQDGVQDVQDVQDGAQDDQGKHDKTQLNSKEEASTEVKDDQKPPPTAGKRNELTAIDYVINDFTLKTMSNFFILVGILAFLSFATAVVGVIYGTSSTNVLQAGGVCKLHASYAHTFVPTSMCYLHAHMPLLRRTAPINANIY